MNGIPKSSRAAFTLTELLVVIVIISILSTIALPVYISNTEKARKATAQVEVEQIAQAQEKVGIIHGFYVPLQLLDDIPGAPGDNFITTDADAIGNESTNIELVDINQPIDRLQIQPTLGNIDQIRVRNLLDDWEGPFMSFQRVYIGDSDTADPDQLDPTLIQLDYPMDPWGQPYRFYSPRGIIGTNAYQGATQDPDTWRNQDFSDGNVTDTDDRFDRFTIVSFGPDLVPGDVLGEISDDIFYEFGSFVLPRNETSFTQP